MSSTIQLNGQSIALVPQERGPFMHLCSQLVPQLDGGGELGPMLFGIIAQGLQSKQEMAHPIAQATLWMLWQSGVRSLTLDLEQQRAQVLEAISQEERARDTTDPYSQGGIACGRGNLHAVSVFTRRAFRLDGEVIRIRLRPPEDLKTAMKAVQDERLLNEAPTLTAARLLAGLVLGGTAKDDPRVLAMLQVLADHGVSALRIDPGTRTITFEGFEPEFAAAAAYLQGADAGMVQRVRQSVREMVARATQVASGGAVPATAGAAAAAGAQPAAGAQAAAASPVVRQGFKRRRR